MAIDLKQFRSKAAKKKKSLTKFLQKFDRLTFPHMNKTVAQIDKTVWQDIDCKECANCCKTMTPTYSKADIKRISDHLGMKPKEFKTKWLYKEEDNGDWVNKEQPCQFLVNNMCSIYEVRPKDCAEFPHHHQKPFDQYNDTFIQNLHRCPATFTLVERLKEKVEKEYVWE